MHSDSTSSAPYVPSPPSHLVLAHSHSLFSSLYRWHIRKQLNNVLFQLHTVSFFLAPALLPYLARLFLQLHFYRPREVDPELSLRIWFGILVVVNFISVWTHLATSPPQPSERSVILDFVGPASAFSVLAIVS